MNKGFKNRHHSEESKRKMSESAKRVGTGKWLKGRKFSEEHKRKLSESKMGIKNYNYGRKFSKEHKEKIGKSNKYWEHPKGEKHPCWKGGISFKSYSIDWTETLKQSIRERDRYVCRICGKNGWLVHHIDYNKENCNLENLITLCSKCHPKTNQNREYWIKFFKEIC